MSGIEATSLLGQTLATPIFPVEARARLEAQYAEAKTAYEHDPDDADAVILIGQRTVALGRFQDAIAIFSEGIAKHPDDARLYRHRGHRFISTRQYDRAIPDLTEAARLVAGQQPVPEIPAGSPPGANATYTLQFNIWYHLGLAQYLLHQFAEADPAYRACAAFSRNDETLVAVTHWHYMTLRRAGQPDDAVALLGPIHKDLAITENGPYHRLTLLYKGDLTPEAVLDTTGDTKDKALMDATASYGVGNWYRYNGKTTEAESLFRRIVDDTPPGMAQFAFGYLAAESDLQK